jgi:hypothetical protein
MAEPLEFCTKLAGVITLSIVGDPKIAVAAGHRLTTPIVEVDNG